ncbi:MAG: hypothetical protein PHG91_04880 [Syntrophales bacterium]|nr:hypothetical protein [Syntrophales bacterium]MDD5232711.1 hypothetical protein [Syntrophales bacterium]MDD5532786.1 hypothetical protein [Syntrophales bacterium]HPL63192.1 hypothetical protein [Syntrophales bacterium]
MDCLESILHFKYSVLYLQGKLFGSDRESVDKAQSEFVSLVDKFFEIHPDLISERQYRTSRDNSDYFLVVLETAIESVKNKGKR